MEKEDDIRVVNDRELLALIKAVRHKDPHAMMKLIELFEGEIARVSKFIPMPTEDAISTITLELLEIIIEQDKNSNLELSEKL